MIRITIMIRCLIREELNANGDRLQTLKLRAKHPTSFSSYRFSNAGAKWSLELEQIL